MKVKVSTYFTLVMVLGLLFSLSSCVQPMNGYSTNYNPPMLRPQNPNNVKIQISNGSQRLYLTEGERVLLATPCSTGLNGRTRPGSFRVTERTHKRRSNAYGQYPLPNWLLFDGGNGIHAGFVKPYPCTHGCVRVPQLVSAKLFAVAKLGTPVIVANKLPWDSTVQLPVLNDDPLPNPPNSYTFSDQPFTDATVKGSLYSN
jgi:hypothetical protein